MFKNNHQIQEKMADRKVILIIMDGWGIGQDKTADAIFQAATPNTDSYYSTYPNTTLITFGEDVGLPEGQMGNSEVGHLNLGAGRIVYQELQRINIAARDGELAQNPVFINALQTAKATGKKLHLMGLVSDGGVHSHTNHLKAMLNACKIHDMDNVFIHAFTDGRDTDPKSGYTYLLDLLDYAKQTTGKLATITGRYYAMDRDKRWERVNLAYQALVNGSGEHTSDPLKAVLENYEKSITDEFLKPIIVTDELNKPVAKIEPGDVVICFNFRTDRCREITQVLTQTDMTEYNMRKLPLHYVTMTEYDKTYENVQVIFKNENLENTLGAIMEKYGKTQVRIAETEKYPHVTFFFNGGRENPFEGETRILIPSPKVATYDLQPEMSAFEVTEAILPKIESRVDFVCLNFANTDMVGHTGVFSAAMKAAETVDKCVGRIVETALEHNYDILLTADHGNADMIRNPDGSPNTAHTKNPVPLFYISNDKKYNIIPGKLADIAPTILFLMGIPVPPEMTGDILLVEDTGEIKE